MFENLIRELRRLDGQQVSISLPTDADNYLDRECPAPSCLFEFKVFGDDWRDKVKVEGVFCPSCGHTSPARQWNTQRQVEHARSAAIGQIQQQMNGAIRRDAEAWNRRQPRQAFIRMTMQVGATPRHIELPAAAAEPMQLKIACSTCGCRYAVIGSAFFCPACGHNAADRMFHQALEAINRALDAIPQIRLAVSDKDTAETTAQLVIENGLQNAVTAFQRYAESVYTAFPGLPPPRRNVFQNLGEGSDVWRRATGKGYADYLSTAELAALTRLFQQRHLLAHTQGLVDADYIARSGDATYRQGQRLVIRADAVRECLTLIRKLTDRMTADTPTAKEPDK